MGNKNQTKPNNIMADILCESCSPREELGIFFQFRNVDSRMQPQQKNGFAKAVTTQG